MTEAIKGTTKFFKLKQGVHGVGSKTDPNRPRRIYRKGEIVPSEQNLVALCGGEKFEEINPPKGYKLVLEEGKTVYTDPNGKVLGPANSDVPDSNSHDGTKVSEDESAHRELLEEKTIEQLREIADDEEIDLSGLRVKGDIIDAIIAAGKGI